MKPTFFIAAVLFALPMASFAEDTTSNNLENGSANPVANNSPMNNPIEGETSKPTLALPATNDDKASVPPPATTTTHHHRKHKPADSAPTENTPASDANPMGAGR
jgi:hypothetical protein